MSHQSRCSILNFWKTVISIIFVRFTSINLQRIFIQDSVCTNNWNSCMGVEYVCPVFYPFCTKYFIRGKSLSFPINYCKSSLKTKFELPSAAHYHYQHHKLPSCLHHSDEYLSHCDENRLQSHQTFCMLRNYYLVTAQVLASLRPPYFKWKVVSRWLQTCRKWPSNSNSKKKVDITHDIHVVNVIR